MVGSTPTRFRQIFPFFKSLADRGAAKGSNKRFGSGSGGRFRAARTVTGFHNLDARTVASPEGEFYSFS
ncbi:MAG: hypothetical protein DMG32_12405 [Acidobacteria bacterium]|nr:MAG: hypothetical protein DMG32_12405 [Acidobacteriota bacterium]